MARVMNVEERHTEGDDNGAARTGRRWGALMAVLALRMKVADVFHSFPRIQNVLLSIYLQQNVMKSICYFSNEGS